MIHLCRACGTSYDTAGPPPVACAICDDERQFIPPAGQRWVTPEEVVSSHANSWTLHEPNLFAIHTTPRFAIGQRAFLVRTPAGNILWDCIACLDPATRALVDALGGLHAIAISHPHYYTAMQDWALAFDAPIHLHMADRRWVMRDSAAIRFWDGDVLHLVPGVSIVRLGGHFTGGSVLHWCQGPGVVLAGDIIQVTPGGDRVSFLLSYPNMLPLPASTVERVVARIAPYPFERLYGAFPAQDIHAGARDIVLASGRHYVECLTRTSPDEVDGPDGIDMPLR